MRIFLFFIPACLLLNSIAAQNKKTYRINSIKEDSSDLIRSLYRYPQFQKGFVAFKNKPLASANLNYNYLSGQILFTTPKGEAMELSKPETLEYIAMGVDTFYYVDKGYVEMITHYPIINLSKKETIKFNGEEKKGAYGTYSSTTTASSINTISRENVNQKIPVDENTIYARSTQYYLSGRLNNFIPATKKSFYKIFSKDETKLSEYLKSNSVHYNKEEDLLKLLEYLQSN
ncbi:MAG TPA: hypothetical protein VGP55_14200 [Chitinophagaceae bacterium]|nr:hypothetical protein [Chitinophagaceae bacterium]